ncbi:hypothetical protein Tco_0614268, partial [Tanacetum coccineum]
DEQDVNKTDQEDDDEEQTESDDDGDDFVHPKLTTHDEKMILVFQHQTMKIVTMKMKERMLKEQGQMKRLHMKKIKELRQSKIPI